MNYTACFTGRRPQKLSCGFDEGHPAAFAIKTKLYKLTRGLIVKKGVTRFMSGMALGTDFWGAEIVMELKNDYPQIALEAVIPCRNQSAVWKTEHKKRYNDILSRCDKVTILQEKYTSDCMVKRNRYMADKSNYVLAVWDGKNTGGTWSTIKYAVENKKSVYYVDTKDFKMKGVNVGRSEIKICT